MARTMNGRLPALERALRDAMPARRLCTLDEVARFVGVLAGDDAAWFNGATIDFTGGEAQGLFDALIRASMAPTPETAHDRSPGRHSHDPLPGGPREHARPLR